MKVDSALIAATRALMLATLGLVASPSHGQSDAGIQQDAPQSNTAHHDSNVETKNFLGRFIEAYRQDWSGTEQEGEEPRRIPPSPLSSPPFPSAD